MSFKAPVLHLGTWSSVLKYMMSLICRNQCETNSLHFWEGRCFSANSI